MLARPFIVAALAVTTSGCVGLGLSGGVNAPASGMDTRVVSGNFEFVGWIPIKRKAVLDFTMGYELGPLGKKSNALFMMGGRLTSKSRGWHPGYYGSFLWGWPFPNDFEKPDAGPTGAAVHAGAGVAWTTFAKAEGTYGPASYGSVQFGFAYHHQEQDNIGVGDFIGLELTLIGGGDLADALSKWEPKD
ncbi:MAG TPA: hypothetical protein VM513_15740 [Kofleriaceae bacterium]|jgi:hypothetical protein|nr:hypothetical protein [Kofleriaceae bacterium]